MNGNPLFFLLFLRQGFEDLLNRRGRGLFPSQPLYQPNTLNSLHSLLTISRPAGKCCCSSLLAPFLFLNKAFPNLSPTVRDLFFASPRSRLSRLSPFYCHFFSPVCHPGGRTPFFPPVTAAFRPHLGSRPRNPAFPPPRHTFPPHTEENAAVPNSIFLSPQNTQMREKETPPPTLAFSPAFSFSA